MNTNRVIAIVAVTMLIPFSGCGEKLFTADVDCDSCYEFRPEEAELVINLSLGGESDFRQVPLVIYKGEIEDNEVVLTDTAYGSPFYWVGEIDTRYTVKAEYTRSNRSIWVVDSRKVKALLVSDACDIECYVLENEVFDTRIKGKFISF